MFIKHRFKSLILGFPLLACAFLSACGSGAPVKALPKDADVFWGAEENAVLLKFKARPDLNLDQGQPSSLSVCVYQLADSRMFEQLRSLPEGRAQLAACESFGETVVAFQRLFLEPGQTLNKFLDRREEAKFVGLAAAYYNLESERCLRLWPIPIVTVSDGWFSEHREPGQLVVEMEFGSDWPEAKAEK